MNSAFSLGVAHALHVIMAIIWIGGMLFTVLVLRPAILKIDPPLEPPVRLSIFHAVLKRFFILVWVAVVLILFTGYWLLIARFGDFGAAPLYVHLMHIGGLVMAVLFVYLYFTAYWPMKRAFKQQGFPAAAESLDKIRRIVQINLMLGLVVVIIATAGRYF